MEEQYYVYMMTNPHNTVLYTGVTNDLVRRVYEHRNKLVAGFTSKYNITRLVYYELSGNIESAIAREKHIKGSSRRRKLQLISSMNPGWNDLYPEIAQ